MGCMINQKKNVRDAQYDKPLCMMLLMVDEMYHMFMFMLTTNNVHYITFLSFIHVNDWKLIHVYECKLEIGS